MRAERSAKGGRLRPMLKEESSYELCSVDPAEVVSMMCCVDCRSVQSQMAAWSAGELSPAQVRAFEEHCVACASCRAEWKTFQETLVLLSALAQPMPCEEISGAMWNVCCEDWITSVENRRLAKPLLWEILCGWATEQSVQRWNWTIVSGVAVIFGGAWMLSSFPPSFDAVDFSPQRAITSTSFSSEVSADTGALRFLNSPRYSSSPAPLPYNTNQSINQPIARRVEFAAPVTNYEDFSSFNSVRHEDGTLLWPSRSMFHRPRHAQQTPVYPSMERLTGNLK